MVGHRPVKMPAPNTVDLLLVYDKPAAEYVSGEGLTLEEHGAINIAAMNKILTTTDIDTNVWFRLVGTYTLEVAAPLIDDALEYGLAGVESGWEMVHDERNRVGADVVIIVSAKRNKEGLAYFFTPTQIKNNSSWANSRAYSFRSIQTPRRKVPPYAAYRPIK